MVDFRTTKIVVWKQIIDDIIYHSFQWSCELPQFQLYQLTVSRNFKFKTGLDLQFLNSFPHEL